jgi:hypothetical protein
MRDKYPEGFLKALKEYPSTNPKIMIDFLRKEATKARRKLRHLKRTKQLLGKVSKRKLQNKSRRKHA